MVRTNRDRDVVLLVEDDPNDVLLVQRAFSAIDSADPLQVVRNGEEAIAYFSGEGVYADRRQYPLPTLVLMDLKLPRKSGFEVLAWLKAQPGLRRIPVVVFTSSRESVDVNRAYDLGANSYLSKPVAFAELTEMVKTLNSFWLRLSEQPELQP